ncbi:MAG: hypothetical protein KGJ64_12300 [Betaproteobacteria bacterium]|nr:hypothetical protein [Betaproteobacteria bacterium]
MKKLAQLIFGDWRNVLAVAASVALAVAVARAWPQAGGWVLLPALLAAAWWQAGR